MDDTTRRDLISVLVRDHRDIEEMFAEIEETAPADGGTRKEISDRAIAELSSHTAAEAQYLYPTVRLHIPDGDGRADREIRGHASIELLAKQLADMGPDDLDFGPTLAQLMGTARSHFAEEEALLFPKVVASCTAEQLAVLGAMVTAARSEF